MSNKEPREHPRFYRSPSEENIATYGVIVAREMSEARADRISSRLFSAFMATVMGTSLTIVEIAQHSPQNIAGVLSNYIVPSIANTIGEIKAERLQHHYIQRVQRRRTAALEIAAVAEQRIADANQRADTAEETAANLRTYIIDQGLPLPELPPIIEQ